LCRALAGTGRRPLPLRRQAGRPQLKGDPLDGAFIRGMFGMKLIELNMTPAQINRSIQLGWGGAALSAIATLLFTFIMSSAADTPLIIWAVASAAVTSALGYGVYRRSRRAAVTLLILFLFSRIWFYLQTGSLGSPLLSIIFLYCFVEGVRGTFAHHRTITAAAAASDAGAV